MMHTVEAFNTHATQYHHMWSGSDSWMWLWPLLWLVLIGLLAFGLVRWLQAGSEQTRKSTIDIVKERYAKGEIDRKEYEQLRKDLWD